MHTARSQLSMGGSGGVTGHVFFISMISQDARRTGLPLASGAVSTMPTNAPTRSVSVIAISSRYKSLKPNLTPNHFCVKKEPRSTRGA